jgi:hypothetical protein
MQHTISSKMMEWRHTDSPKHVVEGEVYGDTAERIPQNYISTCLYCSENNGWRKGEQIVFIPVI